MPTGIDFCLFLEHRPNHQQDLCVLLPISNLIEILLLLSIEKLSIDLTNLDIVNGKLQDR